MLLEKKGDVKESKVMETDVMMNRALKPTPPSNPSDVPFENFSPQI